MSDWWINQEPTSPDWWLTKVPTSPDWWSDGSVDGPVLTNLILNGTFESDTDWDKGDGFAIADGRCSREATEEVSVISQSIVLEEDGVYLVRMNVLALSDPLSVEFIGGDEAAAGDNIVAVGSFETQITAKAGNNKFAIGVTDAASTCVIDNVRLFQIA